MESVTEAKLIPYSQVIDPLHNTSDFKEPYQIYEFYLSAINDKVQLMRGYGKIIYNEEFMEKLVTLTNNTIKEKDGYYYLLNFLSGILNTILHINEDGDFITSYRKYNPTIQFKSKYVSSVRFTLNKQLQKILG